MILALADTHTIIWYFYNDSRLSSTARKLLEDTASDGNEIGISSISLVEIVYLIEKGRIASESLTRLAEGLDNTQAFLSKSLLILRSLAQCHE